MAEKNVQNAKNKYDSNASQAHPNQGKREEKAAEPSGEGTTLAGKPLMFGDRAQRAKPDELKQKVQKKFEEKLRKKDAFVKKDQAQEPEERHLVDVLNVQIMEDLIYRPRSKETKAVYEQMMQVVQRHMGDYPLETIKGALDEVLAILKTEGQGVSDQARKTEIEAILEKLTDTEFNGLTVLGQQLTDYQQEDRQAAEGAQEMQVDPEMHFSQSESSDFEEIYQVRDDGREEAQEEEADKPGDMEESDAKSVNDGEILIDTTKRPTQNMDQGSLSLEDVDAQFLNHHLSKALTQKRAEEIFQLERTILALFEDESVSQRDCERKLFSLIGHTNFSLVKLLLKNRQVILYGTRLAQAQSAEEQAKISERMDSRLSAKKASKDEFVPMTAAEIAHKLGQKIKTGENVQTNTLLDFERLKFEQGGRLMTNKKCLLPKGSTKVQKNGYDEIYVPAPDHAKKNEKLVKISDLPQWAQKAFPENIKTLNVIQSRLYNAAFKSSENILVCAPTGAGKTNIAMLAILQTLASKQKRNGHFDLKSFKIVYIAPMKALVSEIVGNFQQRLADFGILVKELTGDTHLTRQQIEETQIIVTTPEKWDIITRKTGERAYIDLVKLVIIDEIHLLHDSRGPVLEAIVSRTMRQIESSSELVRIVALSATLPNYEDVATFLRVNTKTGLFHFDNSFRPVPLEQIYVGISEKKALKRLMLMNEICYEKVIERVAKHQVLIFTHSRKETARTAKIIRDMALSQDELHKFQKDDSSAKELLLLQVEKADSQDVKDVLPFGIGIHHAGLSKRDRKLVEDLFAQGYLQVLVSTATLAWGVNLPAHTVIIKGTQVYSPEKGTWIELSPQDILQMMGRAGRPQFDSSGEGIILTNQTELQYYLSLNNMQLPIESQLISSLADQMCAEIVLGTVSNVQEAVDWLGYTYLFVRMLRSPELYGVKPKAGDPLLLERRHELVYTAATVLSRSHLVKFDKITGSLQSTALGKIASHYYIRHQSMQVYNDNLKPYMNSIDIFRLFSLSKEFEFVPIRENEKLELQKFIERVPLPVKGTLDEPATKINVLLQAYISRFKLEGFDLNSDMIYVTQSASRIMRALFEIAMKRGWSNLAQVMLNMCKMVEKRLWNSMTPLRQFSATQHLEEIARKIEKKAQFQWHHFYEMNAQQLGEVVGFPKLGKIILNQIHKFPRLELEAFVQPLTRTLVRVELSIKAHEHFVWDTKYHGNCEPFWIIVEDNDSEQILHAEQFLLSQYRASEEHRVTFTVPLCEPMPPQYFIKVISDRWLQAETTLPISFKHLLLPEKFAAPTQLEDLYPRLVKDMNFEEVEKMYGARDGISEFNQIQTQTWSKLYQSDESVFVGAPIGSDLLKCAEFAIFKELQNEEAGKVVYVTQNKLLLENTARNWKRWLVQELGLNLIVVDESQTFVQQAAEINKADIILATASCWEAVSRRWRQRKVLHTVSLYIFDNLHLLSPEMEVVVSRVKLIQSELKEQQKKPIRVVGLACPIANAQDIAKWLGVSLTSGAYFNFSPAVRPQPLEASVLSFDMQNRKTRLLAMAKPAFNAIKRHLMAAAMDQSPKSSSIVFVPDRKQSRLTALDFVTFSAAEENPQWLLSAPISKDLLEQVQEASLRTCLEYGIGFLHDGLTDAEVSLVKQLFQKNQIRLLLVEQKLCYFVSDCRCNMVVLLDVEKYDGTERRYVEYSIADLLQMQSTASEVFTTSGGSRVAPKCLLMCYTPRKDYFVKFMQEPVPVESQLHDTLLDFFIAEVVAGTISNKQDAVDWLTWTFLYHRLAPNPNFYNLTGRSAQHVNDYLSELVENTIEDLVKFKCIEVNENEFDITAANLGRIAAFYAVKCQTIGLFAKYLADENFLKRKMRALLNVLSQAAEFDSVPIREGDEPMLRKLASLATYPVFEGAESEFIHNEPHIKANILLQCHFNRKPLSVDFRTDLRQILEKTVRLVHAMVDVISTFGHLSATLLAVELSQMVVQAMWPRQSSLYQLPGFDQELVEVLKCQAKVEEISDFMNMEDDVRQKLVPVSEEQMATLASVCNRYPIVELSFEVDKKTPELYEPGESVTLTATISREEDADEESLAVFNSPVSAQFYPLSKSEEWWVIVGHVTSNKLLAIKKVSNFKAQNQTQAKLSFPMCGGDFIKDGVSVADLKIYLVCDSYVGLDLQEKLQLALKV